MKLRIVFENDAREGFKSGWGFSCLIDDDILFDTGCDGQALLYNLGRLGSSVDDIKKIVLSHRHWDHIGGLFDVLSLNKDIDVYVLESFSENLKAEIQKKARLKEISGPQKITGNIFTTGLIESDPDEQALIIKTDKGIVLIVGCSHPGVDRILDIAKDYGKVYAIIGGFHGFSELSALEGIDIIGACHCTQHKAEIKKRYPKQYKEIKAGVEIEI